MALVIGITSAKWVESDVQWKEAVRKGKGIRPKDVCKAILRPEAGDQEKFQQSQPFASNHLANEDLFAGATVWTEVLVMSHPFARKKAKGWGTELFPDAQSLWVASF